MNKQIYLPIIAATVINFLGNNVKNETLDYSYYSNQKPIENIVSCVNGNRVDKVEFQLPEQKYTKIEETNSLTQLGKDIYQKISQKELSEAEYDFLINDKLQEYGFIDSTPSSNICSQIEHIEIHLGIERVYGINNNYVGLNNRFSEEVKKDIEEYNNFQEQLYQQMRLEHKDKILTREEISQNLLEKGYLLLPKELSNQRKQDIINHTEPLFQLFYNENTY